ncbi:uncharacterized protein LOC120669546 [Panicum virgatum]|nr:uncharacterized protein LOC120669546 [Panicum virgatum]
MASPARLIKLYRYIFEDQRKMIAKFKFDGLLKIACTTMPVDFANWLMSECFDPESSELVLLGRGRILVTPKAVANILNLSDKGDEVKYELDVDAINFIYSKYGIIQGQAPRIEEIMERIKQNKRVDEDFLRSWMMIAVSTFLCPPTSLGISPRCYPALLDLTRVNKLNWCQFVVDQLKEAVTKMNKQNSVRGCILLLVILYVDSLDVGNVQIPTTKPRIAAWSRKLLDQVIKLDTNRDGSFGKLKLKLSGSSVAQVSFS